MLIFKFNHGIILSFEGSFSPTLLGRTSYNLIDQSFNFEVDRANLITSFRLVTPIFS
jgi:hypothetical protein